MLGQQVVGAQRYLKKQLIGNGGFARCYLMECVRTGERLAGKVIRRRELRERGARAKVMQQVEIHRSTDHPNVVKIIEVFDWEGEMFIILQLCQNNTLKGTPSSTQFIRNRVRITEFQARCYLCQLVEGLQYLHGSGIVHRDIKLGNVFLNNKMQVKIGDFGLSARLAHPRERRYTTCGTPNYIAPQILAETGHSCEVDVWALGIILYAFLVGKPPFESETVEETYRRIRQCSYDFPKQIPISPQARSLIRGLLQPNPRARLTLAQVRGHEFITAVKVPALMPAYTISIPPQSSYLKQWVAEKPLKLSVYPRKVSQGGLENSCVGIKVGKEKLSRVLSCDKNIFKLSMDGGSRDHSQLNRGVIFNTRMKVNLREDVSTPTKVGQYEQDGNEIICYYDVSTKYGIGYLLSNGSCGVAFNDQTSLTESLPALLYFDGTTPTKMSEATAAIKKKVQILKLCGQKLQQYRSKNVLIPFQSQVFVKRFIKYKQLLVLKLSNGVLQFFWSGDSVTLRGYRWVRWRIGRQEGEGPLTGQQYPPSVEARVAKVRDFLQKESERSQRRRTER